MTALTYSLHDIGEYLYTLIRTHQVELGLADVYYGDRQSIPVTPVICVETDEKRQELVGATRRVDVTFNVYLLVYHNAVQDTATTRREVEERAEAIETLVHSKPNFDGLVIHAMVSSLQHGYIPRAGVVMRASRLTVQCQSRLTLPAFPIV